MFSSTFHLFCLLPILCISFCVGNPNLNISLHTERHALLKFRAALIDENDSLSSWKGEDCCKWDGITCDNSTGHVTKLNLTYGLKGKIQSSLCELQYLTSLRLSENKLEGKIPQCIGSLGQLTELNLEVNYLVGAIPHALGNLSNLQLLHLGMNPNLVANDLEWVSHLSNLTYLYMSNTNLSQAVDWPTSISKLPSLLELELDQCGLPQFNINSIPQMNASTSLRSLHLSGNYLNSSTLSWVLNVSKVLIHLDLSNNSLQHIPEGFANMISLDYLDLSYNELEGSIPKSFKTLCQLQILTLSYNKLSGQLSDYVPRLCSNGIWELDLSNNQLNGSIPYTIGQLSNLMALSISSNSLIGVIDEAHLSNLSNLQTLMVDQTSLSFNVSSSWVPPFQLTNLYASSCILGPTFPSWLKHQKELQFLEISNCSISGSLPKWFWDISPGLKYLNVSHNKLRGSLPKSVAQMNGEYLEPLWDLSFNNFLGTLPQFSSTLRLLDVSNNMFSGSISCFCETPFPGLSYLDLSKNFLEGRLPDCWGRLQGLQVLNLATKNFSGRIPKSFDSLQEIETIHLNNNNFSGEIPSLTHCSKLKLIDFGDNNLEGTLPAWVGQNLNHLIVLHLRANKFQGSIPTSLCNLLHLQVLDLSKNNITGKIPDCLDQIIALTNIKFSRETISYSLVAYLPLLFPDKEIVAWKGENREYGKILGLLTAIDLSRNQLTGKIPISVAKLAALFTLNLSRNNLTGFIPDNIGHMKMLEALDLSRNYLYGRIPASISNLTFLSYMNMSFNNLSKRIPISPQLQTFDASTYIGNPGLCGQPLLKKCPGDENSRNPLLTGRINRSGTGGIGDELISFGFYVSLVLGFIIGFWGVCGTLILKTSWRYTYFQFFNNMYDWIFVQLVVIAAWLKRRI